MPGFPTITATTGASASIEFVPRRRLTLAYTAQDALAPGALRSVARELRRHGATVALRQYATLDELVRAADADLVLLGWSPKISDEYNILDLFPCGSAFNVAHWCDRSYDALMRQAVRTLDDRARWRIEREILAKLPAAGPAVPISQPSEYVRLAPGIRGFSWSPIGFYELDGMTRS
jgi:ABC-type oligopeptide transport system substrate-binding subunit